MLDDIRMENALEYYKKYVKYPSVDLADEKITINGIDITPEQIKDFRVNFVKNSEACYNLSDLQKLFDSVTETVQLSDPLYHLFVPNDPKNDISFQSIQEKINNRLNNLQSNKNPPDKLEGNPGIIEFIQEGAVDIYNQLTGSLDTLGNTIKKDFFADANAFAYILKRLNIQEILFTRILCLLKGVDPNAQETAALLAEMPNTILNYISYIQSIQELKGAAWLRALEQGISFDVQLFCNDELTYFLKGITSFLRGINAGINGSLTFIKEIDSMLSGGDRATNPYKAIIDGVLRSIYATTVDYIFDLVSNILTAECDDPLYNNSAYNFGDVLNTHIPIINSANNEVDNKDPLLLRVGRKKALEQSVPDIVKEFQYGADYEYTIDLIALLINDIKCILTPIESVDLLKGNPTEEVIIIIKNIIRNKFSKDPNNLSYLLNDDKLKLFFEKLGLTVDPQKIEEINNIVTKIVPASVCTPEQYQIRCELFKGKLPPELKILESDTRNRLQKARKLLDKIKEGDKVITINALCPDGEDPEIDKIKENMIKQYKESIRSVFSDVLNNFTQESSLLNSKISENKDFFRKDGNGTGVIFDKYSYNTYYENLSKNMLDLDAEDSTQTSDLSSRSFIIKYQNKEKQELTPTQIQDLFFQASQQQSVSFDKCAKPEFEANAVFTDFLSNGRIIWENLHWNRNWDNTTKQWKDRAWWGKGEEAWESWFSKELRDQQPQLREYIKEKGYVIFISSETLPGNRHFQAKRHPR